MQARAARVQPAAIKKANECLRRVIELRAGASAELEAATAPLKADLDLNGAAGGIRSDGWDRNHRHEGFHTRGCTPLSVSMQSCLSVAAPPCPRKHAIMPQRGRTPLSA